MYDLNKKPPEKNHANSNMHSACVRFLSSSNTLAFANQSSNKSLHLNLLLPFEAKVPKRLRASPRLFLFAHLKQPGKSGHHRINFNLNHDFFFKMNPPISKDSSAEKDLVFFKNNIAFHLKCESELLVNKLTLKNKVFYKRLSFYKTLPQQCI
jgi:hypothetical protein